MAIPRVSVIIPNWNGQRFLEVCLQALQRQTYQPHEVVLVDNASIDDSVDFTRERFPEVRVECLPRNVGFAGGVNAALARQADIHHHHIRLVLLRLAHGLIGRASFGDDFELGVVAEQRPDAQADYFVIIN